MCHTCSAVSEFDEARSSAFVERMLETINCGATAVMTGIGHRTGLFDAMADSEPRTSDEIAQHAGLAERYVREWLGTMVTGRIVEYDASEKKYRLPAEHAGFLTRAASPNNLAVTMQWISQFGASEDLVVDAFRHGQGVPYSQYRRFHEVMAEESDQTSVAALDEQILPLVPGLSERLREGIDVIDVGCGRGRAILHLASKCPASRFTGIDLSEEPIGTAREDAARRDLTNVRFEAADAAQWRDLESYDCVLTFDAIHDQAWPDRVLANIHQALRPGGVYLMQEISASSHVENNVEHPLAPFIYAISTMHCMSVSLAAGGMGLGAAWGRELAEQMLRAAGFESIEMTRLEHDFINDYFVCRKA